MTSRGLRLLLALAITGVVLLLALRSPASEETSTRVVASSPAGPPLPLAGLIETARGIEQFERRVAEDPRDFLSLTILGQLHLRDGREKAQLASFRKAEQAFSRALALNPQHQPARTLLASAYVSQHQFAEALQIVKPLVEQSPGNIEALAVLADVYLETGQYPQGEDAVRRLTMKAGALPAVLARRAQVAELYGRSGEAAQLLQTAAETSRRDAEPPGETAWYEARIGDVYLHGGCLAESERHFMRALQLLDSLPIALTGVAEVRVAQGRLQEAADLYARAVAVAPEPRRLFALGAVEERVGRVAEAARRYEQGESVARGDGEHAAYFRDLSAFYAERLGKAADALGFAQKDFALRQDVRAYDMLAWALFRNTRVDEAASMIEGALKLGTRDPGFSYHAGMIYEALGQMEKARGHLAQALQMSPQGQSSSDCRLH